MIWHDVCITTILPLDYILMLLTMKYSPNSQSAFTLIELIIVVAIVSILAGIATFSYRSYIVKSQVAEALSLAYGLKTSIAINVQQGTCFADKSITASPINGVDRIDGKYGTAEITSTAAGLPPCSIAYTFKSIGVSSQVKGKMIVFIISENGALRKFTATNVADKYLPKAIQ